MIDEDTEPEIPIRQLSLPPPMKAGAIALGGGVLPGALPLYVVELLLLTLFEFELLVIPLPCWFVLRLSTVALFCAMTDPEKANKTSHFILRWPRMHK